MSPLPPNGDEEPEISDPVMLSVLSNRGRKAAILTADQERLLDEWVDGGLAPEAAERAVTLAKGNTLAAERVLERRLLQATAQSPAVPRDLSARVLQAAQLPRAAVPAGWWRRLGIWRWTAIAGAAALASIVAVVGVPIWQQTMQDSGAVQVAMVTIGDRNALFEPSDIRMRGPTSPPGPVVEQRFRDVEVPASILKGLLAAAAAPRSTASREIEPYLSMSGDGRPSQVVVDSVLRARIEASADNARMPVRIYDLEDPRSADLRPLVGAPPKGRRLYLLTIKP
ncbi:hypothetical protein BH11PSE3_BH11PSE3_15720 [soil metagenome]